MKLNFFRFLALAATLALLGSTAYAQSINVRAQVPFNFVVGDKVYPAGEYTIQTLANYNYLLYVGNRDTKESAMTSVLSDHFREGRTHCVAIPPHRKCLFSVSSSGRGQFDWPRISCEPFGDPYGTEWNKARHDHRCRETSFIETAEEGRARLTRGLMESRGDRYLFPLFHFPDRLCPLWEAILRYFARIV